MPSETKEVDTSADDIQEQESTEVSGILKVHHIDVCQADCILIVTPGGKTMLIDAGNNEDSDAIITYLKQHSVSKIDILIGTHPHEDHIGSIDSVIKKLNIGTVYLPKASSNTKTFEDVLLAIKAKGLKINQAAGGLSLDLGPEIKAEMIAPNSFEIV
ncbi:MAG: MBL fold metallo-hydrolase [Dehalobacterium sp.]